MKTLSDKKAATAAVGTLCIPLLIWAVGTYVAMTTGHTDSLGHALFDGFMSVFLTAVACALLVGLGWLVREAYRSLFWVYRKHFNDREERRR